MKFKMLSEDVLNEKNLVKVGDPITYQQAKNFYNRGYIDLLVTNDKGESEPIKGFHSAEAQKEIKKVKDKKGIERPVANKADIQDFDTLMADIQSRLGNNITITTVNPQTNKTVYNADEDEVPDERVTGYAYKLFKVIKGGLYPPMVKNPGNVATPVHKWIKCGASEFTEISSTWGKPQTSGTALSYRPGWHLGELPYAPQFEKKSMPGYLSNPKFVWALCEYNATVDYQERAMSYGYSKNGKFTNSAAGLPYRPENGYYKYRTNPNPNTIAWVITGEMKVVKVLDDYEVKKICDENGVPFLKRVTGMKTLPELGLNESLHEDTVKTKNGWTNKGKEGTHGKFKTKKQADAQRKAMFANGYHEGLDEDNQISESNELEQRAKKHRATDKKGARGWFVHPNSGDPKAIDRFNKSVSDGATGTGESTGSSATGTASGSANASC